MRASPALSSSKRKVSGSEGSSSNTLAWKEAASSGFPWSGKRIRGSDQEPVKSKYPAAPWNIDVQNIRSKWENICFESDQQQTSNELSWGNNGTYIPQEEEGHQGLKDPYGCYFGSSSQSFR